MNSIAQAGAADARPPIDRARILKAAATIGILGSGGGSSPRILTMLCDPKAAGSDIASVIAREPSLYARVLRVANSAYYGQARSINTIERALMLLGRDAVRGIAAAACLDRTLVRGSIAVVDMQAVIRHSLTTAAAAQALAAFRHRPLGSEAFIAGLLHNLGIQLQMHVDSNGIDSMITALRGGAACDIRALEREHALIGHEECLAAVFEAWLMPESLVAAARHHHEPMQVPESHRDVAALVNLGTTLALAIGHTFTLEPGPVARQGAAMDWLGLTDEQLDAVAAELPARAAELAAALA